MAVISLFSETTPTAIGRPAGDDDALEIARNLATIFAARAGEWRSRGGAPKIELQLLARSGLLGISVPSEFGGIDVSNAVLSEVASTISQADPSIAIYLQEHFYVLDLVRSVDSDGFKWRVFTRALSGALFGGLPRAKDQPHAQQELVPRSSGPVLTLDLSHDAARFETACNWIGVRVRTQDDRHYLSILDASQFPVIDADDFFPFTGREKAAHAHELPISDASLAPFASLMEIPTSMALRQLIGTSVKLGTMKGSFRRALDIVGSGRRIATTDVAISQIGSMAARLDGANALIEHASKILDIAQVTPARDTIENASRAALAADIVVAEASIEIESLLRDLTKTEPLLGSRRQPESHWRASAHISSDHYYQLGALHLSKIPSNASGGTV